MYLSELEDLENIIDILIFEDEESIFTEEYTLDLIETSLHLMEEYMNENPTIISEPDFEEILLDEIKDFFYLQMEDHIIENDDIEDDMNDLLEDAFNIFITTFYTERSINNSIFIKNSEEEEDIIEKQIQKLRNIIQPEQRTPEWYKFRHTLITASNAYKAFESQSTMNQLIYEKCQPLKTNFDEIDENIKMVNTNTTLHWGQKYEPLSVMIYENNYNTKVEDFGCIQHDTYKFIGASPDGIIVNKDSERYGRMLEIKNIVNREINGIPKKEYWVQMQLQMEVCDLDECDFLETKFIEYPDRHTYNEDSNCSDNDNCLSKNGKTKGIIIYFHTKEGKPFYVYKPLNLINSEDINNWEEETLTLYQSTKYNYTYMKFIYWKLEILSCVLVLRNKDWFKNNIHQLEKIWKIIEEERITGYEHRAPNRKIKKDSSKIYVNTELPSQGCLLKLNKIIKSDSEINKLI